MNSMCLSDSRNTDETFGLLRNKASISRGSFYVRVDRYTILEYRGLDAKRLFYPSPYAMQEIQMLMQQEEGLSGWGKWLVTSFNKLKESGSGEMMAFVRAKPVVPQKGRKRLKLIEEPKRKRLQVKESDNGQAIKTKSKRKSIKTVEAKVSKKKKLRTKGNINRRTLHSK